MEGRPKDQPRSDPVGRWLWGLLILSLLGLGAFAHVVYRAPLLESGLGVVTSAALLGIVGLVAYFSSPGTNGPKSNS